MKRAFAIVADGRENLNGLSAYDKLVSDALDIGQLFFEIEKRRDLLEILVWDKAQELAGLKSSRDASHVRLGKTYRTYLQQDASEYRFDIMDKIYLLNYVGPGAKSRLNIIGATSPATLFSPRPTISNSSATRLASAMTNRSMSTFGRSIRAIRTTYCGGTVCRPL